MIIFFRFRLINDHELKFVMCIYLNNLTHVLRVRERELVSGRIKCVYRVNCILMLMSLSSGKLTFYIS